MPRFRADVSGLAAYEAGRPIDDIARTYGVTDLIKLASNENPLPPFEEVQLVIAAGAKGLHRYPDNNWHDLGEAVAKHVGVDPDQLWFGGGSSELLRIIALALGGPGTSVAYAWPSFVIYRLASVLALSQPVEVPLDSAHRHDLAALRAALRPDTTVVYICNPNNPTGTHVGSAALADFIDQMPDDVMVVIDEAYAEYAAAPDYRSMVPLAVERPNLIVTRTFSKVYGLAGLRIGYAVTAPTNVVELRKAQAPFTVSNLAQLAAVEALRHPHQVAERAAANATGRSWLTSELTRRGIECVDSQANFVYARLGSDSSAVFDALVYEGVIIRSFGGGWVRITVGTPEENGRFMTALDGAMPSFR